MKSSRLFVCGAFVAVFVANAQAAIVNIEVRGTVDFNVIGGGMSVVQPGNPVVMSFNVDSNNFVNSGSFPTRGYPIDLSSFSMTVAAVSVPIVNPQPGGQTAYFVLRNNDPAVDGFLLSTSVDFPFPVAVNIPGLAPVHDLDFLRTFNDGTPLTSLDILDAVGTYGLENLSVFNWTIGRFGNPGASFNYQSITITPEPATIALLLGATALAARRRR